MYPGAENASPGPRGARLVHSQQVAAFPARSARVAVVDPLPGDYSVLLEMPWGAEFRWNFLSCGRDALRLRHAGEVDLWVVHLVLPDMPGLELCGMLRTRLRRPVIYVIADQYRAADERAARARGAALFGCKPVQAWWFEPWAGPPNPGGAHPQLADSSILHS